MTSLELKARGKLVYKGFSLISFSTILKNGLTQIGESLGAFLKWSDCRKDSPCLKFKNLGAFPRSHPLMSLWLGALYWSCHHPCHEPYLDPGLHYDFGLHFVLSLCAFFTHACCSVSSTSSICWEVLVHFLLHGWDRFPNHEAHQSFQNASFLLILGGRLQ